MNGAFVISLDFELYWGVRDSKTLEHYRENLLGVREAMPLLLKLLDEYNIKATFATVGLLGFDTKESLLTGLPTTLPNYTHAAYNLTPDYFTQLGHSEQDDPYHFGLSIIQQIQHEGVHEIASHTFSHYYTLEEGSTIDLFKADLEAYKKRAHALGIPINTIIFPRNQYNAEYLKACKEAGFMGFRGTEDSWIYKKISRTKETLWRRAARIIDAYWNISGIHCYDWQDLHDPSGLYNIPASRFLRPYSKKLRWFEVLRLKRITNAMTHAAMNEKVFHLWWHPHNFGKDIQQNMNFLRSILEHQQTLHKIYGFESRTMNNCYSIINNYEQR